MLRSLEVAATGMVAQESKLDSIANNLANASTTGYKRQEAEFEDLLYQNMRAPATNGAGAAAPAGVQLGSGTRIVSTARFFTQGAIQHTGNPLDIAIEGNGFIAVQRGQGELAYTRSGSLKVDAQGRMTTSDGLPIEPPISVPPEATSVAIAGDGTVTATMAGQSTPTRLGQIQLATFPNPSGLNALGHNLFQPTASSGEVSVGLPGTAGRGTLLQGSLEGSNVEVVTEMIGLIRAQRAYEINSKVINAADEMLRNASQVR